ncbi:MAG: Holliday junction resolvase RuvX [Crocinitomicaceae bacterium]|nr:Holliday junction resolvase RuvX [Crocinitomicaceae bacterium]|tara:strand:- start:4896 stop:5303 length:408 start_codon:yes stop_codon:yes gene_type:complete
MGKILSIDYGLKRTGLAYSDDQVSIAHPLKTVETNLLWDFLNVYFSENSVHTVVLGFPTNLDGTLTDSTSHVKGFKKKLSKEFPLKNIVFIDERFTSKIAKQSMILSGISKKKRREKGVVDEIAAVIILQDYLNK